MLRNSVTGTIDPVADHALLGRTSNWDPDRYRENLIDDSNNDYSNNNVGKLTNLPEGSLCHIFRCVSRRRQFPSKFIPVKNVLSTTTNRLYKCIEPAVSTYVNDHSANVVYLKTYNKSRLQYVEETSQNLNKRFSWHNSCFRNPTAYSICKNLNNRFSKDYIKDSSYNVHITEKIEAQDVQTGIL